MKKTTPSGHGPALHQVLIVLVSCSLLVLSCKPPKEKCEKCNEHFKKEKKLKQISHVDAGAVLKEKYRYFYQNNLVDSIYQAHYNSPSDSVTAKLKINYPALVCIPSAYKLKTYVSSGPVPVEKGMMTINDKFIVNKHIAFYTHQEYLGVSKNVEIDYLYDGSGKVTNRNGTDFGLLTMLPSPYGNISSYTYTGDNVTHVTTQREQGGYTLTNTFDSKNNPFSIQLHTLYYLFLTSYPDEEYFETICLDKNNPTEIIYQGTDTSNSFIRITYAFTYVYDADNYPKQVSIKETKEDSMLSPATITVTDWGTYNFVYY